MKRLGLFRHAKSDWDDISLRDFDRGLNDRGRKGAALMGAHMRDFGAQWELVIASAAERVRRTLEAGEIDWPTQFTERAYLADPSTLIELVREHGSDNGSILLAGHNPGLQDLACELAGPDSNRELLDRVEQKLPTASFVVLEFDIDEWSELANGTGRLVHFARPRDLDAALGPEV